MKKTIVSMLFLASLGLASAPALADVTGTVRVEFEGPGGHSSGAYGATSAIHAAGRALMIMLQDASLPTSAYKVSNLKGGNSVNSIASDGVYDVAITAVDQPTYDSYKAKVEAAAIQGAQDENAFRSVTTCLITSNTRRDIRVRVDGTLVLPATPCP
jgi:metal-dependent amidase/aminoacylase/carboxypeptidase family protein